MGDRVKGHALNVGRKRLLLPQHFLHVPADRLAFAIGVGGEDQSVGMLRFVGDRLQLLRAVRRDLPQHFEVMLRIHRPILGRKIAHVTERSEHPVSAA